MLFPHCSITLKHYKVFLRIYCFEFCFYNVNLFQDEDRFQELNENGSTKDENIQQKLSSKVVSGFLKRKAKYLNVF